MSERDDSKWPVIWIVVMALIVLAYFEVDSRIHLSYICDLQRRVAELEQRR